MANNKVYYDVVVEAQVPATLRYRILAESPEEAYQIYQQTNPSNIKYHIQQKRNIKMTIYDAGSTIIRFMKRFL